MERIKHQNNDDGTVTTIIEEREDLPEGQVYNESWEEEDVVLKDPE